MQPRRRALPALVGPEPTVGLSACECRFDPDHRFLDHALVAQDVAAITESLEPVGGLFPAVLTLAAGAEPCVAFLLEEAADLGEVPVKAVRLQFELLANPALRLNGPDRQLDKWTCRQGLAIANIEIIPRVGARPVNIANLCAGGRACDDKHKN